MHHNKQTSIGRGARNGETATKQVATLAAKQARRQRARRTECRPTFAHVEPPAAPAPAARPAAGPLVFRRLDRVAAAPTERPAPRQHERPIGAGPPLV